MQALRRELGVSDQLDFRGLVPNGEVFDLFRKADVVVVPSHREYAEGFPLTMFEAMGSRTPIVCSDHPMFVPVLKDRCTPQCSLAAMRAPLRTPSVACSLTQTFALGSPPTRK